MREYLVFISHGWSYAEEYERLVAMLDADLRFPWRNMSVAADRPFQTSSRPRLRRAIREQVKRSSVIAVIAGVEVARRDWLQFEIQVATFAGKPILGIIPRGALNIPVLVEELADEVVGWNTASIVSAIRRLCS